ncbi:hypothetical protein M3699_13550 [Peribacillus simplex]|uniref:hypothetical protein n=1 Tax=Peribacillus simplex TaxID=1478 RepID=UPI00203EEEFB|nr:hypothetical protein [Peribacillus simplex]MCM3674879.1 hypothetical protein [Peribacillus simplex]
MGNTEVEVCDICLSMQDTKRLQVKRYRGQRYRNVCLPCISEKGLENIPEYNPTKLQEFVDEMEWDAIVPTILYDDNGKEYLGFANGQTNLLAKDKMRFIAEELLKTVELNGLAEFIENHNEKTYMIALYSRDPENTDWFPLTD